MILKDRLDSHLRKSLFCNHCCIVGRPLLGVTWPEMVRTVLAGHPLTQDAVTAAAFKTLKARPA